MTHDQAMQLYRASIDPTASIREGLDWWAAVRAELELVIAAKSASAGARIIEWWHHDWSMVSDRAFDASRRIRQQAKMLKIKRETDDGNLHEDPMAISMSDRIAALEIIMTYHAAINATIKGETPKCFGGKIGPTLKKRRMMKLVRYLSRSIHGK